MNNTKTKKLTITFDKKEGTINSNQENFTSSSDYYLCLVHILKCIHYLVPEYSLEEICASAIDNAEMTFGRAVFKKDKDGKRSADRKNNFKVV